MALIRKMKRYKKNNSGLLESLNLISDKNGTTHLSQRSGKWSLQFPDFYEEELIFANKINEQNIIWWGKKKAQNFRGTATIQMN